MTHPTKAIVPILLDDYRKLTSERKGETNFFTETNVKDCMKKVTGVNINETIQVDEDLEIRAYYAGHVLGAAMFFARVAGKFSVLYTGDYNMTPDRHLGAATIDHKIRPDLLITETTYATTIRGSKRMREGNLLKKVHKTVSQGGKVLIPVFALGRAQELCILIDTYWERMGLKVPVYFSAGLTEKANVYYELFINWTNQKIKDTFVKRNMFDFKHIKPLSSVNELDRPGPVVLFATPGMLHAGIALDAFKKWCGSDLNMCILPGYCTPGTVGNKVLNGKKLIQVDGQNLNVRCSIESLSFSAHADSKGILQLIQQCEPGNVMLVHGEKHKMAILKQKIISDFSIPVFDPANGEVVALNLLPSIPIDLSVTLLKRQFYPQINQQSAAKRRKLHSEVPVKGILVMSSQNVCVVDPSEASSALGLNTHQLNFTAEYEIPPHLWHGKFVTQLQGFFAKINRKYTVSDLSIISQSIIIQLSAAVPSILLQWDFEDADVANQIIAMIAPTPVLTPSLNLTTITPTTAPTVTATPPLRESGPEHLLPAPMLAPQPPPKQIKLELPTIHEMIQSFDVPVMLTPKANPPLAVGPPPLGALPHGLGSSPLGPPPLGHLYPIKKESNPNNL